MSVLAWTAQQAVKSAARGDNAVPDDLTYVHEFLRAHGPSTCRQIADGLGWAPPVTHSRLLRLKTRRMAEVVGKPRRGGIFLWRAR